MIHYYYTPISGYAYLGEPRLMSIASRYDIPVSFKPVDIISVFQSADVVAPARQSPVRLAYRQQDMARIADRHQLPMNVKPAHWPVPADLACRLIHAAQISELDTPRVSFALLSGVYANQMNIADIDNVREILKSVDVIADELLMLAESESCARSFSDATAEAISLGIPGSPTYVLNKEMFFGQDRLDDLEWRLKTS